MVVLIGCVSVVLTPYLARHTNKVERIAARTGKRTSRKERTKRKCKMEDNRQGRDISYHEPERSGGTLFLAVTLLASLAVFAVGVSAAIEDPELFKEVAVLNKAAKWKQAEKSRRHIDNLQLVDHWTMSGKTKIYVDKKGNHVPMDAIERDPPTEESLDITDKDRAGLAAIIGGG